MPNYLLAHDLGTSGNKATLFTVDGQLVASRTSPYPTKYFNGNWAEQDPAQWWKAVCQSTKELLKSCGGKDIAAVALSGQMMGLTAVDRNGKVLRPSILYCDQRSEKQAARLAERIEPKRFYAITGHRISSVYVIEKLMWLKDHEPGNYRKTHRTLCAKDYINYRLTGRMATDYSDASGTNAFDLKTFTWSEKIVKAAGIDGEMLPEALPSTAIVGTITAEAARATGLKAGTPVAAGGGDGSCAAVGVGSIRPVGAYNYIGSSSWFGFTTEKMFVDEKMRTMTWAHCVPGLLHPTGSTQTAGASYRWLRNTLCRHEIAEAKRRNVDEYELMNAAAAQSPVGANGVLFLPYMLGERSPHWNPNARGVFAGMNLGTTHGDLYRAVMEGITMNLATIVEIFRAKVPIQSVRVIGGCARSRLWRQMMADLYGCRIEKLKMLEEATSMGAAVIAGVGAGVFRNFDVVERFIEVDETAAPDARRRKRYRQILPVFQECYRSLVGVYERLAELQRGAGRE